MIKTASKHAVRSLQEFLKLETAGGILLIVTTVIALLLANIPSAREMYEWFLGLQLTITLGGLGVDKPLLLWINDALMVLFFMLVGLELKREVVEGQLSRLDQVDKPGAYLRTAVVNGARSKMRRERSPPVLPAPIAAELGESALELWAALRTLSERRRTAMVLRYWVDLPVNEIAAAMDCRPGTVSSLLHRGLADLRKELADD